MTTAEKAKAYDKALEWMRKVYPTLTGADKEDAEHYFPELKESEDERIREELLAVINDLVLPDKQKARFNAWLEKQKEQKPAEWSEEDELMRLAVIQTLESFGGRGTTAMQIDWLKSLKPQPKQEWSEEDERMLSRCIKSVECSKQFADSETYKAAKDVEMNWLKSLKLKPKQEWSEGDRRKLNRIYDILGYAADDKGFLTSKRIIGDKEAIELQDFLKFLRPSWKPSDGQMAELNKVRTLNPGLDALYQQLKNM